MYYKVLQGELTVPLLWIGISSIMQKQESHLYAMFYVIYDVLDLTY